MAVISWENYVDNSTITESSSGDPILPLDNLKTRQLGDVFRFDTTTTSPSVSLSIDFDLGSAKTTNLICILNHNVAGLGYEIEFSSSPGLGDVGSETGTLWGGSDYDAPNDMLYFSTAYTARYVTINITKPNKIVDIGRIWMDNAWSTNVGMDFGMGIKDRSTMTKSRGGDTYVDQRQILRTMNVNAIGRTTADFIGTTSDFDSFLTMDLACGQGSGEIICLPLTDSQHNMNRLGIYGTISNNGAIEVRDKGESGFLTTKRFTIEEDRV